MGIGETFAELYGLIDICRPMSVNAFEKELQSISNIDAIVP